MPTSWALQRDCGNEPKKQPAERVPPLSRSRDLLPSRHWRAARHRASGFMASELCSNMHLWSGAASTGGPARRSASTGGRPRGSALSRAAHAGVRCRKGRSNVAAWPQLPLSDWADTLTTLQRWTQIVGKTRLALAPMQNHWWQVALYVTARGLGTSPMPYAKGNVELEFDFLDHRLVARTSDGATRSIPLVPRSVADFYQDYLGMLAALGVAAKIWPVPQEMADTTRFTADREHASYDPDAAQRCWRILTHADRGRAGRWDVGLGGRVSAASRLSGRPGAPGRDALPHGAAGMDPAVRGRAGGARSGGSVARIPPEHLRGRRRPGRVGSRPARAGVTTAVDFSPPRSSP